MIDHPTVVAVFAAYLALMLWIGWLGYRRTRDMADYILGGRGLGRWVAALSAGASDMSGWLLLGLPGYAYAAGLASLWLSGGLLLGTWANWRWVAAPLRVYTEAVGDALTLPEYFARRFGAAGRWLRPLAALFILLFYLFYTGSGLVAGGRLFEEVFGLDYAAAVLAGASVVLAYTLFGGFLAVSWTDLVQGLLMAAALLVVPVAVVVAEGGPGAAIEGIRAVDPALLDPLRRDGGRAMGPLAVLSLAGWGLGYFGQPHILARFMALRHPAAAAPARRIAVSWTALGLAGATLAGLAGVVYLQPPLTGADTEKVFMQLVAALFHPLIAGILLAAILAAIMSTADSQLLVASSALAEDFYRDLLRPDAGARELVAVGRGAVALVGGGALWLALEPDSKVLDLVGHAWAGFGAAFGAPLLLSLFWGRMTAAGAFAGIVAGGVTVILWGRASGGWFDLYELVPGFLAAAVAAVLASLAGRPAAEVVQRHRQVRDRLPRCHD